jgi:predicted GNAT family acetyltransferase
MRVIAEPDLAAYAERILPFLASDPVRGNVIATIVEARRSGWHEVEHGSVWLRLEDGEQSSGRTVGAAVRTPPYAMFVTALAAPAVAALAEYVCSRHPDVDRFNGPLEASQALAVSCGRITGRIPRHVEAYRVFRLADLTAPLGVPGKMKEASPADRELCVAWASAFIAEATPAAPVRDAPAAVDRGLGSGGLIWLWEVDGKPRATAWLTRAVLGVTRINTVYTPPQYRGQGYASALVAALTRRLLDAGLVPTLNTDLSNRTSNKIYQALGYRAVGDTALWTLD